LLLAATTGWFYWYCGRLSTNLLIGIAMFEIYHAVQYNAIVWIYNRRLFERAGERFGLLGFMFRDRLAMLGLYLGAIAAYSSIRFFTASEGDTMFSGDLQDARQWLIALFVTSSFLHFYYDGFIWKVSDSKTRVNLVDERMSPAAVDRSAPGAAHAAKWAVLLAIAIALIGSERTYSRATPGNRILAALASLTPNVPEAQKIAAELDSGEAEASYQQGVELLTQGNAAAALAPLREAVTLDPKHFRAHLQLGDALLALDKPAAAAEAFAAAIRLRPEVPDSRVGLADAKLKAGRLDEAEATLRAGLQRQPDAAELNYTLGVLLKHTGRAAEARPYLERAAEMGLTERQ
jgi:Tfp pilus assembly protein PilF